MTLPKRHHYVPQMILNGFTDQKGWLHWCRLDERGSIIRRARPCQLFLRNHLYSTVSKAGIKDPAVERALSILETEAASVVKAILGPTRAGQCPNLSDEQKCLWYLFFWMQWRRTPETQRAVISDDEAMAIMDEALATFHVALPGWRDKIDALSTPDAKARILRNTRIDMLKQVSSNTMGVLKRRGIAILRIVRPNKSFIVGSRPVVKLTVAGRSDLNDSSVEMWLPIASDVAIGVGLGDGGISLHLLDDDRPVRQLNIAIASQSSIIAAGSAALVRSVADRR